MALSPAIFLDKDGTLLADVPYNVDPALMTFAPGSRAGLRRLASTGLPLVVISNQSGLAYGRFDEAQLAAMAQRLKRMFSDAGAQLDALYWCPHHPAGSVSRYARLCDCRKPACGLLRRAAKDLRLDLSASWMIGDILDDVEAGRRAGCETVLLNVGNETIWRGGQLRRPRIVVPDLLAAADAVLARLASRGGLLNGVAA